MIRYHHPQLLLCKVRHHVRMGTSFNLIMAGLFIIYMLVRAIIHNSTWIQLKHFHLSKQCSSKNFTSPCMSIRNIIQTQILLFVLKWQFMWIGSADIVSTDSKSCIVISNSHLTDGGHHWLHPTLSLSEHLVDILYSGLPLVMLVK